MPARRRAFCGPSGRTRAIASAPPRISSAKLARSHPRPAAGTACAALTDVKRMARRFSIAAWRSDRPTDSRFPLEEAVYRQQRKHLDQRPLARVDIGLVVERHLLAVHVGDPPQVVAFPRRLE